MKRVIIFEVSAMIKYFLIFALCLFSFELYANQASGHVKNNIESILKKIKTTGRLIPLDNLMLKNDYQEKLREILSNNGNIVGFNCLMNHESQVFFGIVCHVTYERHRSGNSWTFFIFKDGSKYVGTRLNFSQMLAKRDQCLKNIHLATGLTKNLVFDIGKCSDGNR